MPNSDRLDDADDVLGVPPRKAKSAFPGWWAVLFCALPVSAVVLIGGGFVLFAMRTSADIRERTAQDSAAAKLTAREAAPTRRVYTREDFKAVVGATQEAVVAAIGEPNIKVVDPNRTTWTYRFRVQDPATGQIEPVAMIVFENGVVVAVEF